MSVMEQSSAGTWVLTRRVLLQVHLWIGILFCIPFAILGITGSFLVYDQDFDNVPRATTVGVWASPDAILNTAQAHLNLSPAGLTMPARDGEPAIVRLRNEGQRGFGPQVYVDPVSLAVLGMRENFRTPLTDFMHQLHGSFLLGGATGRPIVGWLGVGMVVLGLSGLALWWPSNGRWRQAIGIRKDAKGFQYHRQLHATTGVLGWIVFVVVSFTGVAISFPNSVGPAMREVFGGAPPPPRMARVQPAEGPVSIDATRAVDLARNAAPGTQLAALFLPVEREQPYRISLTPTNAPAGAPPVTVFVDPYRGQIIDVRDSRGRLGDTLMAWQRTVHDGRAFGPIWAFLVFLSGLMPPLFAVTGTMMWWLKRRARVLRQTVREPVAAGVPAE